MDAKELKKYIAQNNLLHDLLHKLGCHSIKEYSKELRCALPNDDDPSKVSVFDGDDLSVRIFTKAETIYGDIYNLIMFIDNLPINNSSFPEAYKKCLNLLGLSASYNGSKQKKVDHLNFFKKIRKHHNEDVNFQCYDLSILDKYSKIPHIDLIRKDGILYDVIDKYHVRFDERTDRIVFPHFKYDDKAKIVGLIGRTVIPAYKELGIPKYFSMEGIKYEKSKNLYGLSHNIEHIKERGQVIVFEAEKSVMKADMFGYPIGVAVGCHDLSSFQKKLLISLNVEIIITFDKDVDENHVINICNDLAKYRKVSYIKDRWGLLREKDSPVDRGKKIWDYLFKYRIHI